MLDCFRTLEAPGVPFEFTFQSRSGELTVYAQSYSLAAGRGSIRISKPMLLDRTGLVIARLDSLEVSGISLASGGDQIIRIRARNLSGRLTRLKNGQFDLQDYLPQHTSGASGTPYDVEVDRSRVEFVDLNGPTVWTRTVSVPQVKVVGLGQDWVASATGTISETGIVHTRIQNIRGEGLRITGSTPSLELAQVYRHLMQTSESGRIRRLAHATCESLVVHGPFSLFLPSGKDPCLEATVDASARGIRYDRFRAEKASFVGRITAQGLSGSAEFTDGEAVATFRGAVVWTGRPTAAGDLTAAVPDAKRLPAWASTFLPKGASFQDGSFHGWVSAQSATSYHVSGDVELLSAAASNQRFDNLRLGIDAERDSVVLQIKRATCATGPLSGVVSIDPLKKTIYGYFAGQNLDLEDIGAPFGIKQVTGQATLSALVSGSLSNPGVQFESHGQGVATLLKDHTFSLGNFEAAGSFLNGRLQLDQAYFNTPYGLILARGALGKSGDLGVDVIGRGIQFAEYDPNLSGAANLKARVNGTLRSPVANGRIEASDVAYKTNSIQAVVADFMIDRRHAEIHDLEAARGTASLAGNGSVLFQSGEIDGSLSAHDVQIAEWLGEDFVGAVDIPDIVFSGTISHPLANGRLEGSSLITRGVKLDHLTAGMKLDGQHISIQDVRVDGAGGTLSGSATYNLDKRNGEVNLSANEVELHLLSLDRFLPRSERTITLGGKMSATAHLSVEGGNLVDVTANGELDGLALNKTSLGSGKWQAGWINRVFTGTLDVGAADRHLSLKSIVYDPDSQRLKGDLAVVNLPLEDIVDKALPYFPDLQFDARDSLSALRGQVNLDCSFEGTPTDPGIEVSKLNLANLRYRQEPIGDLDARFSVSNHKWDIERLTASKGPADISLKGTIDERGDMHLDATKDNRFDLSKLSHFDPNLSRLTGTAHVWLTADGPTRSPRIVASVNVNNLFAPPGIALTDDADDRYLRFELEKVVIDPANTSTAPITVRGAYFYKGFRGTLSASAPFEYPFSVPRDKPVDGAVTFEKSNLKDIANLVGGFDSSKTNGTLAGSFKVQGTTDALTVSGGANLDASTLAMSSVNDALERVKAELTLSPGNMKIAATGESSHGGTLSFQASVPIDDLVHLATEIHRQGPAWLLDRPVSGSLTASGFVFKQPLYGQSTVAGSATSSIEVGGTLRQPTLLGSLSLASGDVVFKGLPAHALDLETPLINPTFDVNLKLNGDARLRSSTTDMLLSGSGTLKGSIEDLKLDALVTVEKGTVRMPAAMLRLDQGGTVKIDYGIQSKGAASAVVDLEGNTSVTASRYGDLDVQRYDITLFMKGDLLQENGLNLTATSDPADLTQERILGILGETDLLQSLSTAGKENTAVQTALLSAVPGLLDPWTSQLAGGLGLDYLNFEYNAFDLASVTFGKAIGLGLSFEGNRQLSEPQPGFASRYDLRILYHPRRLPALFNQFRFYFGADQDNPWKLGVEYGVRF